VAGSLGTDKDVEALARAARKAGWTVTVTRSNHLRWQAPEQGEFRSPLTGGPSVPLRVRRKLAQLDPAAFGGAVDEADRAGPVDIDDEVAVALDELAETAEELRAAASAGDPDAAAESLRHARDILRRCEDRFHLAARRARKS
jgi:hypothetical protein